MKTWMLRAGEYGSLIDLFIKEQCVALGWDDLGDLTAVTQDDLETKYRQCYPDDSPQRQGQALGMVRKFIFDFKKDDRVVSYNPLTRVYHVGFVIGAYQFDDSHADLYGHRLPVAWEYEVGRDQLSTAAKSSLGSALTLFQINDEVAEEFQQLLGQPKDQIIKLESSEQAAFDMQAECESICNKARDFMRDQVHALAPNKMEHLVAGLLRAMGYKTRVGAKGRDRGLDVLASPDGLGLDQPIIKVQVKHTNAKIGAPQLRDFIGILRGQQRGLYVSKSGFTQEALYEGERAVTPVSMIDGEMLIDLIIEHYDHFDVSTQKLLPLRKTYLPEYE